MEAIGLDERMMSYDGLEGNSVAALTRGLGWDAEVHVLLVGVRKALFDNSVHSYFLFMIYMDGSHYSKKITVKNLFMIKTSRSTLLKN